jgi:hypothetical protein
MEYLDRVGAHRMTLQAAMEQGPAIVEFDFSDLGYARRFFCVCKPHPDDDPVSLAADYRIAHPGVVQLAPDELLASFLAYELMASADNDALEELINWLHGQVE